MVIDGIHFDSFNQTDVGGKRRKNRKTCGHQCCDVSIGDKFEPLFPASGDLKEHGDRKTREQEREKDNEELFLKM